MITKRATITDIPTIQAIAKETWPVTFAEILSKEQIAYMLNWMYSTEALTNAMDVDQQSFFLQLNEYEKPIGFAGVKHQYNNQAISKLHKIYLLPSAQGIGAGANLLNAVIRSAKTAGSETLILNVNRYNKAVGFYEKLGFEIVKEEDIEIGKGFLMEDYVMELDLTSWSSLDEIRWS